MTQTTSPKIGDNVPRYDGRLKVTGEAQYGTDYSLSNPAYAYLATSPIALGRITSIDESEARSLPGVLDILIEAYAENMPDGAPPDGLTKLYQGRARWGSLKDRIQYAFGAQFIEVRVHERTREVRVARAVGAYAAGKIVSQRTAESQLMGGLIWGISAALHESTEMDMRSARYYNNDLAEYLIPVNADIKDITIIMLPEIDHQVNELGIKGIGELGNVGMNAAVANAVFHATGKRVRQLPIRIEKLI